MHKKTSQIIIASATIILISSLFMHAEPARASIWDSLFPPPNNPFITINSNGSITPPNMPIKRVDDVYYLTGNIYNHHIAIRRENAVLDGQGFTVLGDKSDPGIGITPSANNITIRNLVIESFQIGIEPVRSWGGTIPEGPGIIITNNTISDCAFSAIEIVYETNTFVSENVVKNNDMYGIHLRESYDNIINKNTVTNNSIGIYCNFSHDNTLRLNTILKNQKGVALVNPYWYRREVEANVFTKNNFLYNEYGVYFTHSNNSKFFLNNFINNSNNVNSLYNNFWDNGSVGNYWSDYLIRYPNALEIGNTGIRDTPYIINADNVDNYPLVDTVDTTAPTIEVLSPAHGTYNASSIQLSFTVDKHASLLEYSLDGKENITITENITLAGLANGVHDLTFYAKDIAGNTGASEIIYFNVDVPEPFPTMLVAVASAATVAAVGTGLFIYFKKRKH